MSGRGLTGDGRGGGRIQGKHPSPAVLRGLQLGTALHVGQAGAHPHLGHLQVHVLPGETQQLTATHAGGQRDAPEVVERVAGGELQEPAGLRTVPGAQPIGLGAVLRIVAWRGGPGGDVVVEQPVTHQRRTAEWATSASALLQQVHEPA